CVWWYLVSGDIYRTVVCAVVICYYFWPFFVFCFYRYGDHRDLHSFPTRRSSDLDGDGDRADRVAEEAIGLGRSDAVIRLGSGRSDRKSTRLNSSHVEISYAVFCLKKKNNNYYCY